MKIPALMKLMMLVSLACLAFFPVPSVQGLHQNEITLTLSWSKDAYYQGDYGTITITLESTCDDELELTWVGVHFAWMPENYFYTVDLTDDSVKIPSGGSCTFSPTSFRVYSTANIGWNEYRVLIDYNEHQRDGWIGGRWISSTYVTDIHDAYEKTFYELDPQVSRKIVFSDGAGYESPDAKALIQQAVNEENLATSLADEEKWRDAVSHLQTAIGLVEQASTEETSYWRLKSNQQLKQQQQQQQMILIGISAVVIVAIVGMVLMRRRKKPEATTQT